MLLFVFFVGVIYLMFSFEDVGTPCSDTQIKENRMQKYQKKLLELECCLKKYLLQNPMIGFFLFLFFFLFWNLKDKFAHL